MAGRISATPPTQADPAPDKAPDKAPDAAKAPDKEFTFEVGDYATGKHRPASRVPDAVADLLEDLREAHGKEVTDSKGVKLPAGTVKFKTVTLPTADLGESFAKHVRSYSKSVMYPEWSARLSQLSPTTYRVGVGPVKPKPRHAKSEDATPTAVNAAQAA